MMARAQGRLGDRAPLAVVDIGSNSVRLVIYEGLVRSPTVLFNEKAMVGLGRGLATTGKLDGEAVEATIAALRRFRFLADQAGAETVHALATAAAREADNGPAFIERAEEALDAPIRVLSGQEEAYFSALGIVCGFHNAEGIGGDMGGGSLELIDVTGTVVGEGITLPLGGIRLQETANGSPAAAQKIARDAFKKSDLLKAGKGRTFYAVGGTWRNIARLHMVARNYPLEVMHHYEMPVPEVEPFLTAMIDGVTDDTPGASGVSKGRRALIPYGAIVLLELLKVMKPARIVVSGLGVREGYLYSLLSASTQSMDPLIAAAEELAILRARSPLHSRELSDWSGTTLKAFGFEETPEEVRYRQAACLLADIGWRAHPEYRGTQSLNIISHGSFIGVDHPGRAFIALANYYRHEGLMSDEASPAIRELATPRLVERARYLGAILRVAYLTSASMPGVIPSLYWRDAGEGLQLVIPQRFAALAGSRINGRLQQLAKITKRELALVIDDR
jgi:exopolyphosphatase/guanosine-5'-triphosphate,3'-diphosphate pyrophosphatase